MMTRARAIKTPDWAGKPIETELAGWPVITGFESDIKDGQVFLADLGNRPMAMVHGESVPALGACGGGKVVRTQTGLAGILSPAEAVVFDLTGPGAPEWPEGDYTDITEGYVLLGVWGPQSLPVMQHLVSVDIERPDLDEPLFLGTSSHGLFVYVINMKKKNTGFLLACERSHAQNLYDGCVRAARGLGLKPEGIKAFETWLNAA